MSADTKVCNGSRADAKLGCGIDLEVRPSETVDTLVVTGRVEHADVELKRLSDPLRQAGVVGEIIVSQRMDERPQP